MRDLSPTFNSTIFNSGQHNSTAHNNTATHSNTATHNNTARRQSIELSQLKAASPPPSYFESMYPISPPSYASINMQPKDSALTKERGGEK